MGATLELGLPYPEPSAYLGQANQHIRSLAEKVDGYLPAGRVLAVSQLTVENNITTSPTDALASTVTLKSDRHIYLVAHIVVKGYTAVMNTVGVFLTGTGTVAAMRLMDGNVQVNEQRYLAGHCYCAGVAGSFTGKSYASFGASSGALRFQPGSFVAIVDGGPR